MKKTLEIGDRVVAVGFASNGCDVDGLRGRITGMWLCGTMLEVKLDNITDTYKLLPSQCTRLVKKPKPFKVGDRVRPKRLPPAFDPNMFVTAVNVDGTITINCTSGLMTTIWTANPKDYTLAEEKLIGVRPKRKRIWVPVGQLKDVLPKTGLCAFSYQVNITDVEFVEVRKKKP